MSPEPSRSQPRNDQGSAQRPASRRWRPVWVVTGLLAVALAVWFIQEFWNTDTGPAQRGGSSLSVDKSDVAAGGRSGQLDRQSERSQAFNSKVNRANALVAEGKAEEAVTILTEAAQANPSDEDVHYDLGLALTRLGKLDQAMDQYQEALRLYPDYVEAHNNLGNLLMRKQRLPEAIQHFETALRIMPDDASAQNNLGTALQQSGRTNEALIHFERAAKIRPEYWQAHFNVAIGYLQAGRLTESRAELETVLRLKPDFGPAKAALAEIDRATDRNR